jgi:beta-fructofuranosidase
MAFALPYHWVWDFWFAVDGPEVHLFFLHAPKSLGEPELRHRNARIGHAVSTDLRDWTPLPPPFSVGPRGAFDDLANWTGSVLRHDGLWWMFYTGVSTNEDGTVQRIGSATSPDLLTWTKTEAPPVEADARWYEIRPPGGQEAWRDPWVWHDNGRFHMLTAARAKDGPMDGRGVIGYASSPDLRHWEAGPPVCAAGEFSQLEVPQLVRLGGRWLVLFCASSADHSAARLARPGTVAETGTHYLVGTNQLGPFCLERDDFLVGDPVGRHYAGRLLEFGGTWHFFAWENVGPAGEFRGLVTDPMPVEVDARGGLRVRVPRS